MSKRLQVLLPERDLAEIRQLARREQMSTAEWVRQALRAARRGKPRVASGKKLDAIRAASRHAFPAPALDQMLAEIERGYIAEAPH